MSHTPDILRASSRSPHTASPTEDLPVLSLRSPPSFPEWPGGVVGDGGGWHGGSKGPGDGDRDGGGQDRGC